MEFASTDSFEDCEWDENSTEDTKQYVDSRDALEQLAEAEVDEIEVKPDLTILDEPEVNFIMKQDGQMSSDPLSEIKIITQPSTVKVKKFTAAELTCKFCYRTFQFPWIVAVHMNTHTGKRPYKCTTCGKCFSSSGTLSNHRTIHKTVKPFQCEYCDKSFGRRYQLQTHELVHTGEKGYHRCSNCNESFRKKKECTEHEDTCTRTDRVEPEIRYGKLKRRRQKRTSENENSGSDGSGKKSSKRVIDEIVTLAPDIEIKEEKFADDY